VFTPQRSTTMLGSAFATAELIYHNTVRSIRKGHENAFISLFNNIMQSLVLVGVFYVMFDILGMRGSVIRGDFLLFIMSGVFLFMTHTKTMSSIVSSEGPASPMMNHLPMNTAIAIASAAMGALYVQTLSVVVILGVYAAGWGPISIAEPAGAFGMLLLAWFSGLGVGLVFLAMKPWAPGFVQLGSSIYARANMIASGKMFVANALPATMLALFDWNPLFHVIDQARGFTFINYNPHYSSWSYALYVSLALTMIGLMGEFYTRRHASLSWQARR
jgi:ABC-type polysaccharide/polyol phosphate export permease